jgi:hypothetical protein
MLSQAESYTVSDVTSGACFVKIIISLTHVNILETVITVRTAIVYLSAKLTDIGNHVTAFNLPAKMEKAVLTVRGEATPLLMTHLFHA